MMSWPLFVVSEPTPSQPSSSAAAFFLILECNVQPYCTMSHEQKGNKIAEHWSAGQCYLGLPQLLHVSLFERSLKSKGGDWMICLSPAWLLFLLDEDLEYFTGFGSDGMSFGIQGIGLQYDGAEWRRPPGDKRQKNVAHLLKWGLRLWAPFFVMFYWKSLT